ncbi:hypothetical protein [Salipaludibacillus aurantiacus]|uniref:Uncharacterized protein n=1 Tax=Salipaludibacillus aurantiacus TaxID=1601833 RepID=A0A1H9UGH9_9BACI|nr:hypothetical protein [Salipaludibacillus aurantiacus]SES08378.1 hypothetical protein SAMN05518684_107193 [Salipaludibacillus aurantiacus]
MWFKYYVGNMEDLSTGIIQSKSASAAFKNVKNKYKINNEGESSNTRIIMIRLKL